MGITLAIVGRPNVGKSTLFNRLVGKRLAIVSDTPGVTRDRQIATALVGNSKMSVIDTAGFDDSINTDLIKQMRAQTQYAIEAAEVALFVVDATSGLHTLDKIFADWLRSKNIEILLIANKCESKVGRSNSYELFELGFGHPVLISAEHGHGITELNEILVQRNKNKRGALARNKMMDDVKESEIQIAVVGRPNVGKSTLINRMIGENRLLTSPNAGVTRDSISITWEHSNRLVKLVDTAGLRRKSKVEEKLEQLSAIYSHKAIQLSQIVFLLLDSNFLLEKQDLRIAEQVINEGRALIIAVNKWDLIKTPTQSMQKLKDRVTKSLPQARGIPIIPLSAATGKNMHLLMPEAIRIFELWSKRIATSKLNQWLTLMTERHPPPIRNGRRIRIKYITQAKTRPPTFIIFSSKEKQLPEAYKRFLVNGIRTDFGLPGIPIRLLIRKSDNPFGN